MDIPLLEENKDIEQKKKFDHGSVLSRYLFLHLSEIIDRGTKKKFSEEDFLLLKDRYLYKDYDKNFKPFYEKFKDEYKDDFFSLYLRYTRRENIIMFVTYFFRYFFECAFPVALKQLLNWMDEENKVMSEGYLSASFMSLCVIGRTYVGLWSDYYIEAINCVVRNSIRGLIIEKISSLSPGAKKYVDIGKISNNITVDTEKLAFYTIFRCNFYYVPPALIFYFYLVYINIGLISIVTIAVMIFFLLIQGYFQKLFFKVNLKRLGISDKRTKLINEIIGGIKAIKFNAWEKMMYKKINEFRVKETSLIYKAFLYVNISHSITAVIPTILSLVSFIIYKYVNESTDDLSVSNIYELVTIFNATLVPLRYLVTADITMRDALVSSQRINQLVKMKPKELMEDCMQLEKGELEIINGNFGFDDEYYEKIFSEKSDLDSKKEPKEDILKNINLKIKKGEFYAIVGKVGSGKSSLLLALMDELVKNSGEVSKHGSIGYISQEAFLQNETIRENILFGKKFEKKKFNRVLDICEMKPDLNILPGREYTEIGERGVNMSGGQKQRINIARAVYSDSDIYLIDDALSALDAYVGKKIMENVFLNEMKGKTRVMVTHYIHLLSKVDKVILLENGLIMACGTFNEVKNTEAFKRFSNYSRKEEKKEIQENQEEEFEEDIQEKQKVEEKEINVNENIEHGKIIEKEESKEGLLGFSIFIYYFKSAGIGITIFSLIFFAISVAAKIICDWWIGQWSEKAYNLNDDTYMIIFGFGGVFTFLLMIIRAFGLAFISELSAIKIFKKMIWNIFRRPMSFFDTTPTGVIITRCTSDLEQSDFQIAATTSLFWNMAFSFIGSLILASVISPIILILLILGFFGVKNSLKKYFKTAVEIQRITQVSSAPLISTASELIEGSTIVRSYGILDKIIEKYGRRADLHHTANYHDVVLIVWIRARVELYIALVIIATIFSLIVNQDVKIAPFSDPSTSGLIISYLLPLCSMTNSLLYPLFIMYKAGVSLQRIIQYINEKIFERPFFTPTTDPKWPKTGSMQVENLNIRYRKNLPLVLNGVDFDIKSGEKVAIIGRTGSGKSTTLLSFMRIIEMAKDEFKNPSGRIIIDGVDISKIGLHQLRKNLAIIPQEPFLFEDTLRANVDPNNIYTDWQIVEALEAVALMDTIKEDDLLHQKLKEIQKKLKKELKGSNSGMEITKEEEIYVTSKSTLMLNQDPEVARIKRDGLSNEDKLSFKIEQKGSNLSIGQRQLICIARAIIKKPKILLMDEATASIDQKTDSVIQRLIKKGMKGTTVITIAHRLITVVQYDRVIVLENGKKVEEGQPSVLLEKQDSLFTNLSKEGGNRFYEKMKVAANDLELDPAELFAGE